MEKKLAFSLAATAVTLAVGMNADVNASGATVTASKNPSILAITPGAGDYPQTIFTFQPSPNVAMNYELGGSNVGTAAVTTANTTRGNRTYGAFVGTAGSGTARACQNSGTTQVTAPPAATSATTCTF